MRGTLSPRFPLHEAALPIVSPASEPLTGFLAPPLGTAARLSWPGSARAPGVAPTACFRLAPPVPIEQEPPMRASIDLAAEPSGKAVRAAEPARFRPAVDSIVSQT